VSYNKDGIGCQVSELHVQSVAALLLFNVSVAGTALCINGLWLPPVAYVC